jgi:uncharacterized protein
MHPATDRRITFPKVPGVHLFSNEHSCFLFDVEHGKIIGISEPMAHVLNATMDLHDTGRVDQLVSAMGVQCEKFKKQEPPASVPVHAFSLAIAQKCNLGCTYCYAEQGTFGEKANNMNLDVAKRSVDTLLAGVHPGEKITIAFMGGEPLFNRATLHEVTAYAAEESIKANVGISFAITTNATLIRAEDIELFQKYKFTVTVSIDGLEDVHNALRPYIAGNGSFEKVSEKIKLLNDVPQREFALLARTTVTPKNLDLAGTLRGLLNMGFDSVRFSPMLKSPTGKEEMQADDLNTLLEQMIACGEYFRLGINQGNIYPLSNIIDTLKRIHYYQKEQYPCGAGGGYMGVSSKGTLYACHRFVNDEDGRMGDVENGVDTQKQQRWLKERNLSEQSPCTSCWARYMCSGSCHHEVIKRGRPACDYIRGWLHYCLGLYTTLLNEQPELLLDIMENRNYKFLKAPVPDDKVFI